MIEKARDDDDDDEEVKQCLIGKCWKHNMSCNNKMCLVIYLQAVSLLTSLEFSSVYYFVPIFLFSTTKLSGGSAELK